MKPAERAAQAFTTQHGHAPQAVWSAPGRVNLIGEHTDYNDGFVLPCAIPYRTAVAVSPRDDGKLSASTLGDGGQLQHAPLLTLTELAPGTVEGWSAYPAGVAWALHNVGVDFPGADLVIAGDVPTGAGLSSSHALQCAVALALLEIAGRPVDGPDGPSRADIARWVQRSENDFVGAPTGLLDQTASLACTAAHALFFDVRTGDMEQIPFDAKASELELLVIDTRASHSHSESEYGLRRQGCERAAELLEIKALRDLGPDDLATSLPRLPEELRPLVRHIVTENERVLATVRKLREDGMREIGQLLTASHISMRDDYRISCFELDVAVDSALEAGAVGARMTGGGFGGSAIALVHTDQREAVERSVRTAYARNDLVLPRLFTVTPSAGAGKDQ